MTIQFNPRMPNPHVPGATGPNPTSPFTPDPGAGPTGPELSTPLEKPPTDPYDPTPRLEALMDKFRERLSDRISQGDLDEDQLKSLTEMMRAFEGALGEIGAGATEGLLNRREVSTGVQDALAALHEGVEGVLGSDDGPRPVREDGPSLAVRRRLEMLSAEPYSALDRRA